MPSSVPPPLANDWLVATPAARDFGQTYLACKRELRKATEAAMAQSPAFQPLLRALTQAQHDATYEAYWNGIDGAFGGNWAARVVALVRTGLLFARAGADLFDWERLSAENTKVVRRALFERFGHDHEHLLATLDVMQRFFDRSFCAFSEAYVAAAEDLVQQADTMVRLSSVAQAIVDPAGRIHRPNDAFIALYKLTPAQAHGFSFVTAFEPAALAEAEAIHFPRARAEGRVGYDSVHVRSDGTTFPVRIEAVCIAENLRGTTWGILLYDLTERRQSESLRARSMELEAENTRVREDSRAKSEFLANMSHELRTPLNSILGFSQLLAGGEVGALQPQQAEFIEDIHRSGQHLLHLINDVLDLSKVEAGKLEFFVEDVDLHALTDEVVRIARGMGGARVITMEVEDAARDARLDGSRYKQVLLNYVSNALKFSPPDQPVEVRVLAAPYDTIRIEVQDHGVGIAASDVSRLFSMFEQLDAGRAKRHGGTGLGLALTKRIVRAQGGTVGADSAPGVGSTFYALLPRRPQG